MKKLFLFKSLSAQIITLVAISMILLSTGLVTLAATQAKNHEEDIVTESNHRTLALIASHLGAEFDGFSYNDGHHADYLGLTWQNMPTQLESDYFDFAATSELDIVTLFQWDESRSAFIRRATTAVNDDGTRATGTAISPGPLHDALVAGDEYEAITPVGNATWNAFYVPIQDMQGNIVGALAVGHDIANLWAEVLQVLKLEILISVCMSGVIVLLSAWLIRRRMAPLQEATTTITELANGNLEADFDAKGRADEIGAIGGALSNLRSSMQQADRMAAAEKERQSAEAKAHKEQEHVVESLTKGLSGLAKLDLSERIESTGANPFPADYEQLRQSFNALAEQFSETIEAIRNASNSVQSGAAEMTNASNDLSQRTESQAATLEETAAALEELSTSVSESAGHASDAETKMNESKASARETGAIVNEAIEAMGRIEASSEEITKIISVIDEIAFQTNLLALNAGVEAARAGDAGKGFAVVASEVRSLAQRSAESAREIKNLISASRTEVDSGNQLVTKAGDAVNGILTQVEQVAGYVSDIASATREQSTGIGEINDAVRQLDHVTQSNAAMAEQASAASVHLSEAAQDLNTSVGRFNTGGATSWSADVVTPDFTPPAPIEAVVATPNNDIGIQSVPMDDDNARQFHGF